MKGSSNFVTVRAVFKQPSKSQNQSNYSDQSQQEQTASCMNQSQFLAITCNSLEARKKSRVHDAIGFGFASHWLKNWRDSLKPITFKPIHLFDTIDILVSHFPINSVSRFPKKLYPSLVLICWFPTLSDMICRILRFSYCS